MRNYPNFIKAFLEYTKYIKTPKKFLQWSAISVIAGAVGRKVWVETNEGPIIPNLYVALIGPPGVGKSKSVRPAASLLKRTGNIFFASTQCSAAAFIEEIYAAGKDNIVEIGGEKFNDSSVYCYMSEISSSFKVEYDNQLTVILTDLYDALGGKWSNEESWSKNIVSRQKRDLYNPCINLLGASTPNWMVEIIDPTKLRDGFPSRFIFVVHNERIKRKTGLCDTVPDMKYMEDKLILDLKEMTCLTGMFKRTPSFNAIYDKTEDEIDAFLFKNQEHSLAGYYTRKLFNITKVSQLLSLSKSSDLIITDKSFLEAKNLLEELEPTMAQAFGNSTETIEERAYDDIWNSIKNGLVARTQNQIAALPVNRKYSRNIIQDMLQRLVGGGKLQAFNGKHVTYLPISGKK